MSNPTEEEEALQDLMSRHWTKLGDDEAPTEMLYGSAVVAWDESKAIITGGGNESFEGTDCVFMYNKETFETETLPSMLQARWHHAAVIVEANLFVIGGYGRPDGISLNSIEFLDLNNPREWKMFPASLEISRSDCSTVAVNEHEIYIMGGTSGINQLLDSVEILNTATKTISQGPSMLKKRDRFAAALVGDSIVVAGGWHFGQCSNACEQLSICVGASDEEARRWQPLHSNMNTDRVAHHGVSFGDCLVVVGGANRAAPSLKTTEVWNRSTGTWTQLSTQLPVQGRINGVVKLGQDLVCFVGTRNRSVQCLFSAKGLLEHQRRQIRFNELIADERVEIVIPLLLEGLGQRGWNSLFYECIRETNGRLIPRQKRSALGKRSFAGRLK